MEYSMTPLEIEEYARHRLNADSSSFWSSAEIIENYLYNCASELAVETLCLENRYTTDSVADQLVDFPPFVSNTVKAIIASASSGSDFNVWLQAGLGRDIYD